MGSYQQTTIVGNVGGEPELRFLQDGTGVCNFSVAVTEKWGKGDEQKEETTWYRVNVWGAQAEVANEHVGKGMQIMIVGKVKCSAYSAKDGKPAASLELRSQRMVFLGRKGEREEREPHEAPDW